MVRRITIISFLSIWFILLLPVAYAQKVKIVTGEWFPYVSENINGYGFAAEVVTYAFLSKGIETEIVFTSWDRSEAQTRNGEVFAAFPHTNTDVREKFAYFSEPIAMSKSVLFYLKEKMEDFNFKDLNDLKDYKIGGTKGYFYVPMFETARIIVDYASSSTVSFKKLYIGVVDLVPENEFVGWGLIQQYFPDEMYKFGATKKALSKGSLHLMVSKKHPRSKELLEKFNQGLKTIQKKGIYQKLLKKYIQNVKIKMPRTPY